jgi:hypothetical protein
MIDLKHYVPILKGKQGEYHALRELVANVKKCLTPLIEVPAIPWDYDEEQPDKSLDAHLVGVPAKMQECWGTGDPFFLDVSLCSDGASTADGLHPAAHLLGKCRELSLRAVPVIGLGQPQDYVSAVANAVEQDDRGVCIRLGSDDLEDTDDLNGGLTQLMDDLDVSPSEADLIVDLGAIPPSSPNLRLLVRQLMQDLPMASDWRSLVLAATAFPANPSDLIDVDTTGEVPRTEWSVWNWLLARRASIPRMPTFGDYAIAHTELTEVDPRLMQMAASIRYTTNEDWVIVRGRSIKKLGWDQTRTLCQRLHCLPQYCGPTFSWGDGYIEARAQGNVGPGNAATWKKVGTNHHLTFVTNQIANLAGL